MSHLRDESLKQCFSLLREFIEKAPQDSRKGTATLALHQLQRITAGTTDPPESTCIGRPRADGTPGEINSSCIETPLADGTPPIAP